MSEASDDLTVRLARIQERLAQLHLLSRDAQEEIVIAAEDLLARHRAHLKEAVRDSQSRRATRIGQARKRTARR